MKLITIGTSHGAAEKGRRCCANLLIVGNDAYLIDCGCSLESAMADMELPTYSLKAVFITHMHEDHVGGLSAIAKKFIVYHTNYGIEMFLPEQSGIDSFKNWLTALHIPPGDNVKFGLVGVGEIYRDKNITVKAIATQHIKGFPTYAYIIEAEGKRLLFTGDLNSQFTDYPEIASKERFDMIVCELTHCSADIIHQKVESSNTERLLFSHVTPDAVNATLPILDKGRINMQIAADGDVFEL